MMKAHRMGWVSNHFMSQLPFTANVTETQYTIAQNNVKHVLADDREWNQECGMAPSLLGWSSTSVSRTMDNSYHFMT